jgi:predicted DNA-binding transcriptional regulator AlpA
MQYTFRRKPEVLWRFKFSNSQLYKLIGLGKFPPQIRLVSGGSAWLDHELDMIAEAMIAGFDDNEMRALVVQLIANRATLASKLKERLAQDVAAA